MNKVILKPYKNYLDDREQSTLVRIFENNFNLIIKTLNLKDNFPPITYYLYPNEKIKIQEMGEDGNAETDNKRYMVYMVYNKDIQPIGPHELVHILTSKLNTPNFVFSEGLAEYFEDYWKAEINGVPRCLEHDEWVRHFLEEGTYVSLDTLFYDSKFWEADKSTMHSYPESGAFLKYLVKNFGTEKVMQAFKELKRRPKKENFNHNVFIKVFGKSVAEVEKEWLNSLD